VLSVVIPVYRASAALQELIDRLRVVIDTQPGAAEIVLIDDCSPDDSWDKLVALKQQHPHLLKIARLMRNSGQHNAIICGFTLAEGDIVVTMDDDLQNPPEEIPKLVEAVQDGYDLVIGAYEAKQHSKARNASGGLVDRVIRGIYKLPSDFQLTSFRAVRRHVILNVRQMGGVFPYVTTMLFAHTSRYTNVLVRHEPRKHGSSNYNLSRSLLLGANLLLSYSSLPVTLVGFLCLGAFALSVGLGAWVLVRALTQGSAVPGWASTIVALAFFNAVTLLCMFIFALYLSRMNQQITRSKVSFTIAEFHGTTD
jgi:dolichol-phosphate mannosyltransferase/undecaprenyl-phosphate 4-deoxy-4-formamido-L-arabinose transferase